MALLLITSLAAQWIGKAQISDPLENTRLEVDPEHLDFGSVWEQKNFQWSLPIHNPTSRDIAVQRVVASCACTSVEPKSLVIPAGETKKLKIKLDLRTPQTSFEDLSKRLFSVRIAPVIASGLPRYAGWELKGKIVRPFQVSPSVIDFGETVIADVQCPQKAVTVKCGKRICG